MERLICLGIGYVFGLFQTGYIYGRMHGMDIRKHGSGKSMAVACMRALQEEQINKVNIIAFKSNEVGNHFWKEEGWTFREDLNYYDFTLNESNITKFNS